MSGAEVIVGVGAVLSFAASRRQSRRQARAARDQAQREQEIAADEENDFRRRQRRLLATRRAGTAASGLSLAGTPLLIDDATLAEIELNAERIRRGGAIRSTRLEQEAGLFDDQKFGAAGTLLTNVGGLSF